MTPRHGICHVTSVHLRHDPRILPKMCTHLARDGYDTTLVVDDGLPDETTSDGVRIISGSGGHRGRIHRILTAPWRVFKIAKQQRAELYHLHDPELLLIALPLKATGAKVVFDSHEDVPADIREKPYIPAPLRKVVAAVYEAVEGEIIKRLDATISVTPDIVERLQRKAPKVAMVTNYPLLGSYPGRARTTDEVCYTGAVRTFWHLAEAAEAVELTGQTLVVAGPGDEQHVQELVEQHPGRVRYEGMLPQEQVRAITSRAFAGLALNDQPRIWAAKGSLGVTKVFEYMASGLPIVITNYPLWLDILERWDCGFAVDPRDPKAVAAALEQLKDPAVWQRKSETGRRAAAEEFSWASQQRALEDLYEDLGVTAKPRRNW